MSGPYAAVSRRMVDGSGTAGSGEGVREPMSASLSDDGLFVSSPMM